MFYGSLLETVLVRGNLHLNDLVPSSDPDLYSPPR